MPERKEFVIEDVRSNAAGWSRARDGFRLAVELRSHHSPRCPQEHATSSLHSGNFEILFAGNYLATSDNAVVTRSIASRYTASNLRFSELTMMQINHAVRMTCNSAMRSNLQADAYDSDISARMRAVQLLLGHTKIESTVRYLGIEVDDASDGRTS